MAGFPPVHDSIACMCTVLVMQAIQERFGVPPGDLRLWVHYPPSYNHFHVHVSIRRHLALQRLHLTNTLCKTN